MYRRLLYILTLSFLLASCTGCGDGRKKAGEAKGENPVNPMVQELDDTPDDAVLVTLERYDKDSIYVTEGKARAKRSYSYDEAMANGSFYGSLKKGDKYSVLPDNRHKAVRIAVNTTELKGRWIYDREQHRGIDFNEGGGMSSINAESICFREWKLLNGKMYIYYVDQQEIASDRHRYHVEEAYITTLSDKELIIQFNGQRLQCFRPSSQPLLYTGK